MINYTYYPEDRNALYYLEFISTGEEDKPTVWNLYKKNYLKTPEMSDYILGFVMNGEVHPYNLGSGIVSPPHMQSMFMRNI